MNSGIIRRDRHYSVVDDCSHDELLRTHQMIDVLRESRNLRSNQSIYLYTVPVDWDVRNPGIITVVINGRVLGLHIITKNI